MRLITPQQIDSISKVAKEHGVTSEQLLAAFPQRPRTTVEGLQIINWIRENAPAAVPAPISPQAMLAEAQKNWARKDKNGKAMAQYFAVEMDGKPHFFRVKPGYKPGIWFVEEQASDMLYPVRQGERRGRILGLIFKDAKAAQALYGQLIGKCARCQRTLTDHTNPYFSQGLGPECGSK